MKRRKKLYLLLVLAAMLLPLGIIIAPIVLNWLRKGESKAIVSE